MCGRNDLCWCGSGKKWKKCHYPKAADEPSEKSSKNRFDPAQHNILLKTTEQIKGIKKACQVTASILDELCLAAKAGVTTEELDQLSMKLHRQHGAKPAPLHYGSPPFPKSICTSLNEVICHGIPDEEPLKEGDILNIDVSAIVDGYYGDCSRMVCIGNVSDEKQLVVDCAYDALMAAIAQLAPGKPISCVGDAISDCADRRGCSVVYQFVGHGVGVLFHEGPQVFHNRNHSQIPLMPGMTFTIEPMINAGKPKAVIDKTNQWVARTVDGRPSAQWEHTLLITDSGYEILTPWVREPSTKPKNS